MEKTPKVLNPSCSISCYLPGEVWSDILSRIIPVRSLVQFRCVSKTWRALIDDPAFARFHLTRSKKTCNKSPLLAVQKTSRGRECVVNCTETLKTTALLALPGEEFRNWKVSSHVDGLVMLMSRDRSHRLMLWNPSIRKTRKVPPCPGITPKTRPVNFGMGFDPLTQDYKHVVFVHDARWSLQFIAVYTVGTNSWKTIEFREDSDSDSDLDLSLCAHYARESICVGGAVLYSIHGCMSFDLRSDAYDFKVQYPNIAVPRDCGFALVPVKRGSALALVRFSNDKRYVQVVQGGSVWTRRHKFAVALPEFGYQLWDSLRILNLEKNGDASLFWGVPATFTWSSLLETEQKERIMLDQSLKMYGFHVWLYEESLLLLN